MNELDDTLNSLLLDSMPERVEKEEEIISLQPIGRGVHNLEPSDQSPGIKTSPVTSAFPTDGLYQCALDFMLPFMHLVSILCFLNDSFFSCFLPTTASRFFLDKISLTVKK